MTSIQSHTRPAVEQRGRASTATAVRFHCVTRRFGEVVALDGLDLTIDVGETVALLGPNGAGKSTAIGLMLGLLKPTSGTVMTLGMTPREAIASGRIGSMLQQTGLPTRARVGELVAFARQLYPHPLGQTTVLERAGLAALAARPVGESVRRRDPEAALRDRHRRRPRCRLPR